MVTHSCGLAGTRTVLDVTAKKTFELPTGIEPLPSAKKPISFPVGLTRFTELIDSVQTFFPTSQREKKGLFIQINSREPLSQAYEHMWLENSLRAEFCPAATIVSFIFNFCQCYQQKDIQVNNVNKYVNREAWSVITTAYRVLRALMGEKAYRYDGQLRMYS